MIAFIWGFAAGLFAALFVAKVYRFSALELDVGFPFPIIKFQALRIPEIP